MKLTKVKFPFIKNGCEIIVININYPEPQQTPTLITDATTSNRTEKIIHEEGDHKFDKDYPSLMFVF